jgi:two-component system response regulator YesN
MSLKLLLVDDEITTIQRIKKRIDWASLEIGEIRQAEDGVQALEQCESWQPDILVSDIRMPRIDGIKLAETLRDRYEFLQIIFISGYTDKEYLKSAIHLKVVNYIEKPIEIMECFEAIKNACKEIHRRSQEKKQLNAYHDEYRQKLLDSLAQALSSSQYSYNFAKPIVDQVYSAPAHFSYCVALHLRFFREEDRTQASLFQYLSDAYAEAQPLFLECCAAVKHDFIAIFLFSPGDSPYSRGYHSVNDYTTALAHRLIRHNAHFTLGVGRFVKKWEELHSSWQDSLLASNQAFFHELGYISYFRSFATKADQILQANDPTDLVHSIRKRPKEQFIFTFRNLISNIRRGEATSPEKVKQYFSSLILELHRMAENDSVSIWPEHLSEHDLLVQIMEENFIDGLCDFFLEGVEAYYHFLETDSYSNATVNWIVRYVHQNFSDPDMSVTAISQATNLSPTYICHLFKDVTGTTLHNYITEYRMKKAAQLIRNPINRVSDVAEMVGYRNGNYFSFRFKKSFGLSPSEYKEYCE